MKDIPVIPLEKMEWHKDRKMLTIPSEYCGMPAKFFVKSHHTGRIVLFQPVDENDAMFDQDQWDGEQQIYKPVDSEMATNAKYVTIYNQY